MPTVSAANLSIPVYTLEGATSKTAKLNPAVFGVATKAALVSEVAVSAQANRRRAIANALTRGEVAGGGRKPWKQKGTGRARAGSTRSPIWRHGGAVFGPSKERNFTRKVNKKARAAAIRMVLSALVDDGQLYLVDQLNGQNISSTKQAATFLNVAAPQAKHPMLLTAVTDAVLLRSSRNLNGLMIRSLERLGFLDLMRTDQLILDEAALAALEARYARETEIEIESVEQENKKAKTAETARKSVKKPLKPASPAGRSQISNLKSDSPEATNA